MNDYSRFYRQPHAHDTYVKIFVVGVLVGLAGLIGVGVAIVRFVI